jgi:hypothetical protein
LNCTWESASNGKGGFTHEKVPDDGCSVVDDRERMCGCAAALQGLADSPPPSLLREMALRLLRGGQLVSLWRMRSLTGPAAFQRMIGHGVGAAHASAVARELN